MISATLTLDEKPFAAGLRRVEEAMGKVKNIAIGFLAAFEGFKGITSVVTGQLEKMRSSMELGATLQDLSLSTGQSIRDLVILRKAFQLAGMSADDVGPMLARLQKALAGVNEEGEPTNAAFKRLGLSMDRMRAMNAIQQMRELQKAFKEIKDPADRTRTAMEIFGKTGFRMGALLNEPETMNTAEKKAGGFGADMEAQAPGLKRMSIAVTDLEDRWKKFYANVLLQIAPALEKFLKSTSAINFSAVGKQVGGLIAGFMDMIKVITSLIAKIPHIQGALTRIVVGFVVMRTVGPAALRAIQSGLMSLSIAMIRTGGVVGILGVTWKATWAGIVAVFRASMLSMKSIMISTGIGALVVALGEAIGWAYRKISKLLDSGKSTKQADEDTANTVKDFAEKIPNISSEDERSAIDEDLKAQLQGAQQEASAADEADDPKAAALHRRVAALQDLLKTLHDVPSAVMEANAATKKEAEALREAEKANEDLRKSLTKGIEDYQKAKAKAEFDALTPEQQYHKLRFSFNGMMPNHWDYDRGGLDLPGIEAEIERFKNTKDPDEMAYLQKLIDGANEFLEVNKRREEAAKRAAEAEAEHGEKVSQLRAELAENDALLRKLQAEQKLRERIRDLKAAGVADPEKKAQEEIGLQQSADDKKRAKTLEEYARKYARDMTRINAEISGDKATVDEMKRQDRIEQYEKEAKDAGVEDPNLRRQLAEAKAAREGRLDDEKNGDKLNVLSDSDRRIGLGGIGVGVRQDPLVKSHQDVARSNQSLKGTIDRLNTILQANPRTLVVPGVAKAR